MRLTLLTAAAIFISLNTSAQMPKVEWCKAIGGTGNERANGIDTDQNGNIILVGRFQSPTIVVDGIGLSKTKEDNQDVADIFILKLDKKGKALWAVTAGGMGDDHATSCVVDKKNNIYVVGWFESETISFGNISLKNNNFTFGKDSVRYNSDMWVAKFSPKGACLWAKNAGGLDGNGQYSTISLDPQENVIISGIRGSEMNFGNGTKLTSESDGMYVAKYANDSQLLWAKAPIGRGEAQGVCTDSDGNVFIGGYFVNTLFLDEITLKSHVEKTGDAFIAKYTPEGKITWANRIGGESGEIASCQSDPFGNVYLAGLFFSKTIETETDTLVNNGAVSHFISKFDKDGKLLWARAAGGNNGEKPSAATREFYVDSQGNAYCTGSNWSSFNFAGQTIKPVADSEDIMLLKYDKDGKEVWGLDYGGTGRNAGRGITKDKKGNVFLTGSFDEKQLKIDNQTLTNSGDSDIFLVKFSEKSK